MPKLSRNSAPARASKPPVRLKPALLVSYVYLDSFLKRQVELSYRDWVLDSGAFSAFKIGKVIELSAFIDCAKRLMASDPTLTEVFALDVIGDWKASLRNCEKMHAAGVPAIPCYHVGEPEDVLKTIARDYPKIALGGAVGMKGNAKIKWASQCFARVWPKKIHGFGFGSKDQIMALPWHSVDATNWEIGPTKYGRWATYGKMSVRGRSNQNLSAEIDHYLEIERLAQHRWQKEMVTLGATGPSVRLAEGGSGRISRSIPAVRLAWNDSHGVNLCKRS